MKIEYMKGSNVVSISPFRTQAHFPALSRVETYWEALRDGRLMPARAEVDPRGIADVLEFAFILEKIAPGLARIRLAGMHLNEVMAMEVRGMPVTALFLPEARREMQRVIETVLENPAVVRLTLASEGGIGNAPIEAQMMLLPLRDDEGRVTRILGALQSRGEIGRGPRRFVIRDIESKPLLSDDPLPRPRSYAEPRPDLRVTGLSERAQPFAPRTMELAEKLRAAQSRRQEAGPETGRRDGHLRLVHDAERD